MKSLRRPIVATTIFWLAGLLLGLAGVTPTPLLLTAISGSLILLLFRMDPRISGNCFVVLFLSIAGLTGKLERQATVLDCHSAFHDGDRLRLEGRIDAGITAEGANRNTPLLPLRPSNPAPLCSGPTRVRLPSLDVDLPPGTTLEVAGRWVVFSSDSGRGSVFAADPGRSGFLRVDSIIEIRPSRQGPGTRMRSRLDHTIGRLYPERQGMVDALLLGRRDGLDRPIRDRFARAGLSHLLAISGMHVGLFAALILVTLSMFRLPFRRSTGWAIAILWGYLLLIGAPASATRAGIMLTAALLARLIQRPYAGEAAVAAAGLVITAIQPAAILDPGFQLSFAGVLGLMFLRPPMLACLPKAAFRLTPVAFVVEGLVVGAAAFVATFPFVLHHFGVIAPVSVLSGVPALPLLSIALTGIVLSVVIDPIFHAFARQLADGAAVALDLIGRLADFFGSLPWSNVEIEPPSLRFWLILGICLALVWIPNWRIRPWIRAPLAASMLFASLGALSVVRPGDGTMELHFLNVGQGDAIVIRTPANRWILLDTGPRSDRFDAGQSVIVPFLRDHGARSLAAMILTHPDLDHIGGAPAVLRFLPVGLIFEPGIAVGREPYRDVLTVADSVGSSWRAARSGRTIDVDGVHVEFLWPDPAAVGRIDDPNEGSAIVRISFGTFDVMLTGDAGTEVEQTLIDRYGSGLESEILKLGHHGSRTSSSAAFLDQVHPELAIVSAGRNNRYGHPAPDVMRRVEARHIEVARTDVDGTLSYRVAVGGASFQRMDW